MSMEGQLLFANPAAVRAFPTLSAEGLRHCIMADWPSVGRRGDRRRSPPMVRREVKVDGAWYLQVFFHAAELDRVLVYLIDITDRKKAEEALRESERRFRELAESLPQLVWTCRADGPCDYLSPQWVEYTGIPEAEQLGAGWLEQLHPDDRDRTSAAWNAAVGSESFLDVEFRIRRKDGIYQWFKTRAVAIRDGQGRVVKWFGTNTDIDDQKRAEERVKAHQRRLRSLGAKLAVAEEQERRRIAAGLHDNVVQTLALAKMKLDGLARRKPAASLAPVLREVRDLVAQSIDDTRTLLFDLSPVALYELGFEPAVESLLDRIQAANHLATRFRTDNRPKPVTGDVRVVLFRGVREVLQNVVKHAQARSVGVSVGRDGETVLVEVQDDGVGFDAEKALSIHDADRGFGLFDVRERLDYLGGSLTIQSEPGKGTTVVLRAPLVPEKACPGG
jgi:PAS domain S-box-containing protein